MSKLLTDEEQKSLDDHRDSMSNSLIKINNTLKELVLAVKALKEINTPQTLKRDILTETNTSKKELKATYWVRHSSYTRQWRTLGAGKEGKFPKIPYYRGRPLLF